MRSFQQVVVFLFALLACAFAQGTESAAYDATVYVTSTIYRINTVTLASSVAGGVANETFTISATHPPTYQTGSRNATTVVAPTGTGAKPSSPSFTGTPFVGAAASLNANAFVAALAAGAVYLVL